MGREQSPHDLTTVLTDDDLQTVRNLVFSDLHNGQLLATLRNVMLAAREDNGVWLAGPLENRVSEFNRELEDRDVPYVVVQVISREVRYWLFKKIVR